MRAALLAVLLVPAPKELTSTEGRGTLKSGTVVRLAPGASEPERYAAERLKERVKRSFGVELRVSDEKVSTREPELELGVAALPALSAKTESGDGFELQTFLDGGARIRGANGRSAAYAADAFFDLLRRGPSGRPEFPLVRLRDWPTIAWRGRAWHQQRDYLRPGDLDAYVGARLNWVDVRDGDLEWTPHVRDRGGPFGIPPRFELDRELTARTIREAKRRGLFTYGTVFCGVKDPGEADAAVERFRELLELGVDGIWLSFDDLGPGSDMPALAARIVALARERGVSGRRLAVVPPQGSYEHIEDAPGFNKKGAAVPGLADATWFFTRVPSASDAAAARRVGLRRKPAWWHNWPRVRASFLHEPYVGRSLRKDGRPAYKPLTPLKTGWGAPDEAALAAAPAGTDTVMSWGEGPAEYFPALLGRWAWHPGGQDYEGTARAVRAAAFGPGSTGDVREFDEGLRALERHFVLGKPSRLKSPADRKDALAELGELETVLRRIENGARAESSLPPERLEAELLEPMRATLDYARRMALLDFPEHMTDPSDRRRAASRVAAVERELGGLDGTAEWAAAWRAKLKD